MHHSPSPFAMLYLAAAVAAGTATACWVVRRECNRVKAAVEESTTPSVDSDTVAALRRINLRLVKGNES